MKYSLKDKILAIIIPAILIPLIWLLGKTMKIREIGGIAHSPYNKDKSKKVIYAFWHSRLLTPVYFYRNKKIHVLISLSKDGEYIAKIINAFGFGLVRGSSSKGAMSALKKMADVLLDGFDLAITPDGPRGPKQKASIGAVYVSSISGMPIVPFSFDANRKIILNSWDNFVIPMPFSKGIFVWGDEINVSSNANEQILEEKRLELENALNFLTKTASEHFK